MAGATFGCLWFLILRDQIPIHSRHTWANLVVMLLLLLRGASHPLLYPLFCILLYWQGAAGAMAKVLAECTSGGKLRILGSLSSSPTQTRSSLCVGVQNRSDSPSSEMEIVRCVCHNYSLSYKTTVLFSRSIGCRVVRNNSIMNLCFLMASFLAAF